MEKRDPLRLLAEWPAVDPLVAPLNARALAKLRETALEVLLFVIAWAVAQRAGEAKVVELERIGAQVVPLDLGRVRIHTGLGARIYAVVLDIEPLPGPDPGELTG